MNKVSVFRKILIPFSILYSFVMDIRNYLYDKKFFSICKPDVKIISIGNITTGGTGKTPMVIFLAKLFLRDGKKVGIISRGYGRKSKELVIVSDGNSVIQDISLTGDEPALISFELIKEFPKSIFVVSSADRCKSANVIMNEFHPDVILLDDAFQHRRIQRDKDLVMIDATDIYSNNFLYKHTLPSGLLREKIANLNRADLIILNFKESYKSETPDFYSSLISDSKVVKIKYKTEYLIDHKNTILKPDKRPAVIFSGIARPESFKYTLKNIGVDIVDELIFKDHHKYSQNDIEKLTSNYKKDSVFITTGKDFMKINKFTDFINNFPVYYLNMEIEVIDNEKLLLDLL